ncbi:uncharacterized protein SPPG_00817 [Spizellomyces punctatus DAOM BR117]|uniref:Uncharacterized protein n=1 Tax=Spizellomyces punctatus (strain DAOM BR117) TaxID=645134 RepID=A0A0L0HW91_SPIPD|nr:uncharacterized protein SPPG_00817 [Spizellomyces punctatus DAOM BR117]KND05149.1 hypothetical protein SPPG_00817 [Spizellomyces punctatus DAOM BR117]|eukprot:XP_016613188.1 hypothetical protein SPPG_00817 [Spizellomyces punctatus DAOM BR117]
MSQSFATLFRSSGFAALDSTGQQALKTPFSQRGAGNWGLKHDLPKNTQIHYVQVSQHDHPWTKAPKYKSASDRVRLLERWNELMPAVGEIPPARAEAMNSFARDPEARLETVNGKAADWTPRPQHVAKMTPAEWAEKVAEARRRRKEFNSQSFDRGTWTEFLNVTGPIEGTYASDTPVGVPVHPPTYRIAKEESEKPVKGRLLNTVSFAARGNQHWAIGVGGIVAYLHRGQQPGEKNNEFSGHKADRNPLMNFVVEHAQFDEFGRPEVVLGFPPENSLKQQKVKRDSMSLFSQASSNATPSEPPTSSSILNILKAMQTGKTTPSRKGGFSFKPSERDEPDNKE